MLSLLEFQESQVNDCVHLVNLLGMTRDDLFKVNAGIVRDIADAVARNAPKAWIGIITNPVNSTVPVAAEILKKHKVYNPKTLFGVRYNFLPFSSSSVPSMSLELKLSLVNSRTLTHPKSKLMLLEDTAQIQ